MVLHRYWLHLSTIVLALASHSWASFENMGVTRSVDLGGSLVYTTTTYNVKALEDGSNVYVFALTEKEQETTSWMEARVKGHNAPLSLENHGLSQEYVLDFMSLVWSCVVTEVNTHSATYYYSVALPKALDKGQTAGLVLETVQTHAAHPFPPQAAQNDRQALKYDTDLFVLSPYKTLVQKMKFKLVINLGVVMTPRLILLTYPAPPDSRFSVTRNPKKPRLRRETSPPRVIPEPLSRTGHFPIFRPPRIPLSLRSTSRGSPFIMNSGSLCWPSRAYDVLRRSVTGGPT